MERRSDKHSPRVDENLVQETEPLERGAPVESRAEVIEQLARLPGGQVFENVQAVWQTLGGHADRRF
jgi:hypothetical protein